MTGFSLVPTLPVATQAELDGVIAAQHRTAALRIVATGLRLNADPVDTRDALAALGLLTPPASTSTRCGLRQPDSRRRGAHDR